MELFGFFADPIAVVAAAASAFAAVLIVRHLMFWREIHRLRSQNSNMSALLGISELDYFVMDDTGNYLLLPRNARFWKFENGVPAPPEDWIVPEDVPDYKYKFQQLFDGSIQYLSMTYRVEAPEGRRYFSLRAMPIISFGGARGRFVGTVHEITSARKNEQRYHDSLVMLQSIMDAIPFPIFTKDIDNDLRYLTCNRVFAQHTGNLVENTLGRNDFELLARDDAEQIRTNDMNVIAANGKLCDLREVYATHSGAPYYCHSLKKVIELSGKRVLLGISVDITKEELAKRQLAESEEKLREISAIMQMFFDNAPCSFWVKDVATGELILTNRMFSDQMGVASEDTLCPPFPPHLSQKLSEMASTDDAEAIASPGRVISNDRSFTLNDRDYSFHILKLCIAREPRSLLLGMSIDLTDIIAMRKKLEVALERAEAANKAKSYFLASVSHELRTPLNAVIGFSELLQNDELTPAERHQDLAAINYAGNTLLNLINDILDLSKLEAEQMQLVPAPVNMHELFASVLRSFKPACTKNGSELIFDAPDDLPDLMLDDLRLRQVAFNLIGNAVKFTMNGKVVLNLRFVPGEPGRGTLKLSITDTGSGIPSNELMRIFEPFAQSLHHIPGNRAYQGTGLGLPISKRMVERMGGTIEVDSKPGKGTVFSVEVPNVQVAGDAMTVIPPQSEANRLPQLSKALIVDDVPMNLKVLEAMLRHLKVKEVVACGSGREALAIVKTFTPEIVFADVWMPEMMGDELATLIKSNPATSGIPVVAITADTQMAASCKFDDVLLKPVTVKKLKSTISRVLDLEHTE
ncbi:MAG: ATP-binding protein [Victivallaceae bacterium]|nr:ATP-binding protein [Victivallaceae bacterium]